MARANARVGATLASIGLVLLAIGAAVPAAATPSEPIDVCRNQQGASSDCADPAPVGTVTTEIIDGGIVFRAVAAEGQQWQRFALCIPGSTPSPANDCDTTSASVLDPSSGAYSVSGVSGASVGSTSVSFECTSTVEATVPRSTLEGFGNPIPWALELSNCDGGSDEAFGSVSRGSPSGAEYQCLAVRELTATSAVLSASTTDTSVVRVVFAFVSGSSASFPDEDVSDGLSVAVSDLEPNTAYTYHVRFFTADGTKVQSLAGCQFATPAASATSTSTTTSTSTSTTTTSTTSTTTTSTTLPGARDESPDELSMIDDVVLPASFQREEAPIVAAVVAQAAPAQLAATGLSTTLTKAGFSLLAVGGLALFAGRRRSDDDLDPRPLPHPTVPLHIDR